jgi:predicted dehydrogenase
MFYYFGNAEKIAGMATNQGNIYNADDLVAGNILFKGNVVFNGVWCFNTPSEVATDLCEIIGSKGTISFSVFGGNTVTVHTASNTTTYSFDDLKHVQQPMIDATVKYFLDESPNPCTAFEGAEVMRIMEAIVMK